jgi:hypothetical protein
VGGTGESGVQGVDLLLDPLLEVLDCRIVLVNSVEQKPGHEGVALGEAAGQGLGQVGSAHFQPASEQHQGSGVGHPRNQCGEDPAAGNPAEVGDHTGQFDLGVLEELLQPLRLAGTVSRDAGSGPGQVAESRIGGGGTSEARTSPCASRSASHSASATSVLRPGTVLASRALTSVRAR